MNSGDTTSNNAFEGMIHFYLTHNARYFYKEFIDKSMKCVIANDGSSKLLNMIDKHVTCDTESSFHRTIGSGKIYYRARAIEIDDFYTNNGFEIREEDYMTTGFSEGNSREAPLGRGGCGRNNIEGVSYLYLSDDASTACTEIRPRLGQYISVATFEQKRKLKIIDFTKDTSFDRQDSLDEGVALGLFFTMLMRRYFEPVSDNKEYLPTQIITDHIRETGIDGVKYLSYFNTTGANYTFFNSSRQNFEFKGSRILLHQCAEHYYTDFNNKEIIKSISFGDREYNEEESTKNLTDLNEVIIENDKQKS